MKADIIPLEIAIVLLVELLFGIGYNLLVAWWNKKDLVHVSFSVVIGVAGTLVIPLAIWWQRDMQLWLAVLLLTACFTASGVPMIWGSMKRTVARKDDKKRRPWPTAAARIRDRVIWDLSKMAHEVAEQARNGKLEVNYLPDFVNRLRLAIALLKSV